MEDSLTSEGGMTSNEAARGRDLVAGESRGELGISCKNSQTCSPLPVYFHATSITKIDGQGNWFGDVAA